MTSTSNYLKFSTFHIYPESDEEQSLVLRRDADDNASEIFSIQDEEYSLEPEDQQNHEELKKLWMSCLCNLTLP
jgi:hypothetical protein